MTDDEKFLFKPKLTLEKSRQYAKENALDIIALGFKSKNTKFIFDTKDIEKIYPTALEVAKKVTLSTAKAVFGFKNSSNIGQIFYTAIQSVPAFLPSILAKKKIPVLIPHGIDQDPHFRVTRDIAQKLGYYKPAAIHNIFFPGLQPGGKMSASDPMSAIYTTDSPKEVKQKINRAFSGGRETVEEHRKKGGNPDIDVPFQYLRMFLEPDDKKLRKIHDDYKSGKMLSGELKQICIEKTNKFLEKHRKEKQKARKKLGSFLLKA
jgi:tryptophanyl-tRNA synthetase